MVTLVSQAVELDGAALLEDIKSATRGAALERLTGGCEQLHDCRLLDAMYRLTNKTFGGALHYTYSGRTITSALAATKYSFLQAATPRITRIEPRVGMPGTLVQIWGSGLDASSPLTDKEWYVQHY